MPLTDPELDLLLELLEDDPADDVFVQVGEELNRRGSFEQAADVLRAGLVAQPRAFEAWRHLTRSTLETQCYAEALDAWESAGPEHHADPDFARLRILALERSGRVDEAREAVRVFEETFDGVDVVVEAAKERMDAPPADDDLSAADPFLTVALAERYAAMGREDRAIRVYRRILFHHPDAIAIQVRLEQLDGDKSQLDDFTDLSEELVDPNMVPPVLSMPMPAITSASVKPAPTRDAQPSAGHAPDTPTTVPKVDVLEDGPTYTAPVSDLDTPAGPAKRKHQHSALEQFMAEARHAARQGDTDDKTEEEEPEELPGLSEVGMAPRRRKKRRSLLKR